MTSRPVASTNQWMEPNAKSLVAAVGLLFPAQDPASGVWGWTTRASEAGGVIGALAGVLGVDDTVTIGGPRVMDFNGDLVALIES